MGVHDRVTELRRTTRDAFGPSTSMTAAKKVLTGLAGGLVLATTVAMRRKRR